MSKERVWSRTMLAVTLTVACSAGHAANITVFAASSLTNAFKAVASAFEAQQADAHVVLNFAASDVLTQQMVNGAPADVFASADVVSMDKAVAAGAVVADTRRTFANNAVVMIAPANSTVPRALDDVRAPAIARVTYGNPASVPVGRYTQAALERGGLWADVQAKGVPAQNVRQALSYVARGEVDAGFVFATDAAIEKDNVRIVAQLATVTPVAYPIARAERSNASDEADRFIAFVLSPEGQKILAGYGFQAP